MPQFHVPKYRHHKPSGQAFIQIPGTQRRVYLGKFGTPDAERECRRRVAELATTSAAPRGHYAGPAGGLPSDLTVNEMMLAYVRHSNEY